jgi:hypothetical protein
VHTFGARPAVLSPARAGGYNNAVPLGGKDWSLPLTMEFPMRKLCCTVCAVGLLLTLGGPLRSGDDSGARAIIDKAAEAQGGAAKLAKFHAAVLKGSGKLYYGTKDGIPMAGELTGEGADRLRMRVTLKPANMAPVEVVVVVNGSKGWKRIGKDSASPMPKDVLAEEREKVYCNWVATLAPLKDKGFKLAALGEAKVDGRAAVGVRVSRKGHRDVSLYFDKDNHLLLKSAMTVKNVEDGSNTEMKQEIFYGEYKDFGGARWPSRIRIEQGGKRFLEMNFTEVRAAGKLDPKVFAEP